MAASSLGTLLIQRLDAALGTTLSQQTNIINRARPDAVTQAPRPDRPDAPPSPLDRQPRETRDRIALQTAAQGSLRTQYTDARGTPAMQRGPTGGHAAPASTTTTLGTAARIIVQLLAEHAAGSTAVVGGNALVAQPPARGASPVQTQAQTHTTIQTQARTPAAAAGPSQSSGAASPGDTDASDALARQLSGALRQSIANSGLFYEAHLKGILTGQYRLADLLNEPQAQLPARAPTPHAASPATPVAQAEPSHTGAGQPAAAAASGSALAEATPGVDPATHALVRQQLEILADQTIQWRGEAWPGAAMDWRIERESRDGRSERDEDELNVPWQTHLRLQLAGLGEVHATIRLQGQSLALVLQASDTGREQLEHELDGLRMALSAQKLQLASIQWQSAHDEHEAENEPTK